jgi:hypothetical protein
MTAIVSVALVGLATLAVPFFARENRIRLFLLQIAVLAGVAVILHRLCGFPAAKPTTIPMVAGPNEGPVIGVLFACMLLGMLAHRLFVWLETPQRKRPTFDLGLFIAPVLASPIIFVPLLASLQNAKPNLAQLDISHFMLFLVAFQNGFFWQEYFENRRRQAVSRVEA